VGLRGVVLLGDEVAEDAIGERLVAVRVTPGNVDRNRIVVADVLGERLATLTVEDDDAHHPRQAGEEVVLAALVVVQSADDARPRPGHVRLADRLRQLARAGELGKPAAAVLVPADREPLDDQTLFTPVSSTRRPTSARSAQCLPPSCHQPSTRRTSSRPCRAYSRLTSVISSSLRLDRSSASVMSETAGG